MRQLLILKTPFIIATACIAMAVVSPSAWASPSQPITQESVAAYTQLFNARANTIASSYNSLGAGVKSQLQTFSSSWASQNTSMNTLSMPQMPALPNTPTLKPMSPPVLPKLVLPTLSSIMPSLPNLPKMPNLQLPSLSMTSPAISNANFIAAFGQPASFSIPPMPGYQTLAVNPTSTLASVEQLQGCATTSLESCFASMSNGQYASLINNAQASSNAVAGLFNDTVTNNISTYMNDYHSAFHKNATAYSKAVSANNLNHQVSKALGGGANGNPFDPSNIWNPHTLQGQTNHAVFNGLKSGLHAVGKGLSVVGSGLQWLVNQVTNTK